ncbi:cation:proton antiporter [Streptomyces sp. NPDC096132]|uniref:cation:proton antiporter domain-containing protein n=1 Tax=Streptomyces sp. NPDC096132 TaxID=3366075 RepID=UPI003820A862
MSETFTERSKAGKRLWIAGVTVTVLPLAIIGFVAAGVGGGQTDGPAAPAHRLDATGHFFLAAAVILTATHLGGILLSGLGQPRVIGEICAGLALGPSLFGHSAPDAAQWLFPAPSVQLLNGLAQLGLVLFVFGVGREMAGMRLRGAATQAVLVSQASLFIPFALGTAAAVPLVDAFVGRSGSPLAFVLFLGCALSITAFPVLARILADLDIIHSRPGQLSLFAAAIGDGGSWLLLAAVLAAAHGSGTGGLLFNTAAIVVVAVVFLGPVRLLLARWLGNGARAGSTAVAVLLVSAVTAAAAMTAAIGVHQLIGALLVGLAWPRSNGKAAAVAERLTVTAKTVLLPFFFFGFGLTIDFGALGWDRSVLVTLLMLLALAIVGKIGGPFLCAWMTGMEWRPALALGFLLNARGLTELVVIQIGYQAGLIDERLMGILTLVALVTTALTTPLLRAIGFARVGSRPATPGTAQQDGAHRPLLAPSGHARVTPGDGGFEADDHRSG